MKIERREWQGEAALYFTAGGYEALMIPGIGANIIELKHLEKEVSILRTPKDAKEFKEAPQCFGIPLLFPPNRIEDAEYTVNGKVYKFPMTDPANNNHLHGTLKDLPFNITKAEILEEDQAVEIEASFISNIFNNAVYDYFPHEFECRLNYRLSVDGLEQRVTFLNNSSSQMPLGVGFHTALNAPFHSSSNKEDYRLILSAGERMEVNSRMLPTGNYIPLNEEEKQYRKDGLMPFSFPLDTPYTAEYIDMDGEDFHGAVLIDTSKDISLFYEVGEDYRFWTVWNCGGNTNFVCPEPQTWAINAPNLKLSREESGFRLLNPGETWSEISRMYIV